MSRTRPLRSSEQPHVPSRWLWHNSDFLKLWLGETISAVGSQITAVALPLTAALYLSATPEQMGVLTAAGHAPFLFLSLFAGVWVDRHRRRPILIAANIGRAILLGCIPLLAFMDLLRIEYLILISFVAGILTMSFELAYPSFLPVLLRQDQLVEGNSKLSASGSIAKIVGPGFAGVLVQVLSAPFALVLDALSFVVSAVALFLIGKPEPQPPATTEQSSLRREVIEGLRLTFSNKMLRAGACSAATYNFFWNVIDAVLILYLVRQLGVTPSVFGLIVTIGSVGALLGAFIAARLALRFGVGATIIGSAAITCIMQLLLPLATAPLFATILMGIAFFLRGIGLTGWNIHIVSLQQAIVPASMLGRMNSSYLLLSLGTGAIGALLGGILGGSIGLRLTIALGALGVSLAWLWLFFSPLRTLDKLPSAGKAAPTGTDL
jgi:MFS family permease